MRLKSDTSISCVVAENAAGTVGNVDSYPKPQKCTVIESARRLMALGLSASKIEGLEINQPALQTIFEYARLDTGDNSCQVPTSDAINASLKAISSQIQEIDLELEMLKMRKQALKRRSKVLEKIANNLEQDKGNHIVN